MSMSNLDCRACGACCISPYSDPTYVSVTADDLARMPDRWRLRVLGSATEDAGGELVTRVSIPRRGPLKDAEVCACVALRGSPGKQVSCWIYEARPEVCREFKPGSVACHAARLTTFGWERPA